MIGSSLSHFRITAKLGEGGMGEVYRAEDTKLGREVAIKVLPEAVAQDPERLARFEREAQVLASLNHANIAAIYSLESAKAGTEAGHDEGETAQAIRFLVMELVEGEDLAERLDRGAIPIDQALAIAHQIAEALEAAHESGVIHRDLKPANVKVKPDGQVKVLDFGLAKALDPQESGSAGQTLSMSPTLTAQMTQAGVLLGTAAYMSPEQARGQEADKRADIWAFGVLLWEMLRGQRLFVGDTVSDTLAEVLKTEPDPSTLPGGLPRSIRQMLARCLTQDTKQRLRDIGEARIALQQAQDGDMEDSVEEVQTDSKTRGRAVLLATCLALVTGLGGWLLARSTSEAPKEDRVYSFGIHEPEGILSGSFAVSPDGAHIAFLARGAGEIEQLWVRQLDSFSARPMPNTEGARWPFWSPDSRTIAFFVGYELRRIELDGSAARKITDYPGAIGGTWGPDDTILVGTTNGPVHRVAASGGAAPRPALALSEGEGPGVSHGWPVFLPGSGRYFFLSDGAGEDGLDHRILVATLGEQQSQVVLPDLRSAVQIDPRGRLLYGQNNQLVAQSMDFDSGTLTGEPFQVADNVFATDQLHRIPVTISANGTLAFQSGTSRSHLIWRDLSGEILKERESDGLLRDPRFSPDGRSVAFDLRDWTNDRTIWVLDLERGVRTQLSQSGMLSDSPAWSPDGNWVYYDAADEDGWRIYRQPREGSSNPELVTEQAYDDLAIADISPDGRWLLVGMEGSNASWNLWLLRLDTENAELTTWMEAPEALETGRFSPDSRWIAYTSGVGTESEVLISGIEGEGRRWQISSAGGADPLWSLDGKNLYYISHAKQLMSVPIELRESEVIAGAPEELFRLPTLSIHGPWRNVYDLAEDGSFVFVETTGEGRNTIKVQSRWSPDHP